MFAFNIINCTIYFDFFILKNVFSYFFIIDFDFLISNLVFSSFFITCFDFLALYIFFLTTKMKDLSSLKELNILQ